MQFLQKCSTHGRTADKLCGLKKCGVVLCDYCFLQHVQTTGHTTALLLSPPALSFFCKVTGYTHYKMFEWADAVRRFGFFAVFTAEGGEARLQEGGCEQQSLSVIGLKVLQQFQTLTQNNRQFVLSNKNTAQLLHPQFLMDIYNLSTEHWQESAQIIICNLVRQVEQNFGVRRGAGVPKFSIHHNFSNSIQAYRNQMLEKNIKQILLSPIDIQNSLNASNSPSKSGDAYDIQLDHYELPYSIQQIESFEQIGERGSKARNTICSIIHEPVAIEEVEQPTQNPKIDELTKLIQTLQMEKSALQQENRLLKSRNATLQRDHHELTNKLDAFQKANKENQQQSTLSNIPSKGNYILKIPARVLSLAEGLSKEATPRAESSTIGRQMFVRKVRIVK